jgi:hypothetical protein
MHPSLICFFIAECCMVNFLLRLHILQLMESMKKVLMRYAESFMRMGDRSTWMELT